MSSIQSINFQSNTSEVKQCGGCRATDKTLSKCAKCQIERYCSRECQKNSWPEHKKVCFRKEEQKVAEEKPTRTSAASLRVFKPLTKEASDRGFQKFLELQSKSNSSMALNMAQKCADEGNLKEAVSFFSLMTPDDQTHFLQDWQTVEMAIELGLCNEMKVAMEIMENFQSDPAAVRQFIAGVRPVTGSLISKYDQSIRFNG